MTVSSTNTKNSYSGNGSTTAFAYTFKVFDEDDLTVILRTDATGTETVQAITTNYTVSGVGDAGGGNVTFVTAPASGVTVVIRRAAALTQTTDYTPNDPFPASEHENALDKLTFFAQQQQEELDRSIKLSRTNTMTSTEFTVGSSDRANKILGFDGTGELSVTQELGVFRGNWSSGTSFAVRDLIKDTTNNNIYICQVAHTSSGSLPISTNTDSSKWELIVDAATATSSATAAAASEAAAATSETNAATSETNAATSATNAAASEASVAADASAAAASATAASASETAAAASETAAAASETAAAASETAAASSASSASTSASTATTKAAEAATSATNAATSETNAASSASAAATSAANASSSETNAATSASAASTSASNAATSETNAATSAANAATSETNAATSETNAAASATSASSSASTATTKAAEAATSASNAATSETNAATSETNAATSETNAATSATSASTAQTAAETAQTAAEAAKTAAELAADNFDDTYLGAKSSDPTVDNDGDALTAGDLYFNTTSDQLKYYTGSAWVAIAPGIANVSEDTTPQLGGALDVNGNSITSASNGDVTIDPNGTGDIVLDANVQIGTTTEGIADYGDTLTLADSDHCGMTIRSGTSSEGNVYFSDGTSGDAEYKGIVKYDHSSNAMSFWSNSLRRMDITSGGNVGIGTSSPDSYYADELVVSAPNEGGITIASTGTTNNAYLAFADGTSGADRYRGTVQYNHNTDSMRFATNSDTRMTIDSSGNVGIGTASPASLLHLDQGSGGAGLRLERDSYDTMDIELSESGFRIRNETDGRTDLFINGSGNVGVNCTPDATFKVVSSGANLLVGFNGTQNYFDASENIFRNFAGSERARIDSSGNHNFNYTGFDAGLGNTTTGVSIRADNIVAISSASGYVSVNRNSDGTVQQFNRSGNTKGTITINSSGTTYNTTSDIRLKQDIEPLAATDKLMAMNPVSYAWKADPDGPRSMGFIAQEMQEVMPEAVSTGTDDEAMMSMDYGRITPILVSALQDAHRKIEQLEQRLADMEAN